MSELIEIGTMDGRFESTNRVYSTNGLAPTIINYSGGGGLQAKFMEILPLKMVRTEEGKRLRKAYDSGEIHHGFNEYREPEPRTDGLSNTVTTVSKDNYMIQIETNIPNGVDSWIYEIDGELYLIRIRKLTPLECWRLMGFSDEDFEKAAAVNSNTQLYKQAGNSIVKPVLMAIFSQMFSPGMRVENMKRCTLNLLGGE